MDKIFSGKELGKGKGGARYQELNNNWDTICTLVEMIAKDGKKTYRLRVKL